MVRVVVFVVRVIVMNVVDAVVVVDTIVVSTCIVVSMINVTADRIAGVCYVAVTVVVGDYRRCLQCC